MKNFIMHKPSTEINFCDKTSFCARKNFTTFTSRGKSMIEMIGVLTIIALLSVGSISGYQKAMIKHKLNKHAESFQSLIYNIRQIKDTLEKKPPQPVYFADIFKKLGLIPDGMRYYNKYFIKDNFSNLILLMRDGGAVSFRMTVDLDSSSYNQKLCHNIIKVTQVNSEDLWYFNFSHLKDRFFYGDKYCFKNNICVTRLTVEEIADICKVDSDQKFSIYFFFSS